MKKSMLAILLMATLTACGVGGTNRATGLTSTAAGSSASSQVLDTSYANALPVNVQLLIGTLLLEDTPNAVTVEQAKELLPLWQMFRTLRQSGTASQIEIDAVIGQIEDTMTPVQTAAIKEMELTPASVRSLMRERGLGRSGNGNGTKKGGFRAPTGGFSRTGQGPGSKGNLSPEARQTTVAERFNSAVGNALMDAIIQLLESRAKALSRP